MAFKHSIFNLQLSLVDIKIWNHLRDFFQAFACTHLETKIAVLFDWNLSRLPFLGQVEDSDLLLCTGLDSEHVDLFLYPIFTQ